MILVARQGLSAEGVNTDAKGVWIKAGQVSRWVSVHGRFICNDLSHLGSENSCCFLPHILSCNEAAEKSLLSFQVSLVEKIFNITTNMEGGPQKWWVLIGNSFF